MTRSIRVVVIRIRPFFCIPIFYAGIGSQSVGDRSAELGPNYVSGVLPVHFHAVINHKVLSEILYQSSLDCPMMLFDMGMNFFPEVVHVKEMNELKQLCVDFLTLKSIQFELVMDDFISVVCRLTDVNLLFFLQRDANNFQANKCSLQ